MNKKQLAVMWIGLLLAVVVLMLPHEINGYYLFSSYRPDFEAYRLRSLLAIALLTLGGIVTFKNRENRLKG